MLSNNPPKKSKEHEPLPDVLQDIVLSYLSPDEQKIVENISTFVRTKNVVGAIFFFPGIAVFVGLLGGVGTCHKSPSIIESMLLISGGLGGLALAIPASVVASSVTVPIDIVDHAIKNQRQKIANKKDNEVANYFVDLNQKKEKRSYPAVSYFFDFEKINNALKKVPGANQAEKIKQITHKNIMKLSKRLFFIRNLATGKASQPKKDDDQTCEFSPTGL